MFVKKIPRWKIKRFLKRIISAIIFFGILFSFSLSCFASNSYEFKDFSSFVSDGYVRFNLLDSSGSTVLTNQFSSPQYNLNDMSFAYNITDSFNSVEMFVYSPNIKTDFKALDTLVLNHGIVIHMSDATVLDSFSSSFRVDVTYQYLATDEYGEYLTSSDLSFSGVDVLSSSSVIEYDWGTAVTLFVDINSVLPNLDGEIIGLKYYFNDITASTYSFRIFPSATLIPGQGTQNKSLIYYVGSSQNAPSYSSPDYSSLEEYKSSEEALLDVFDSGEERFNDFFNSFSSNNKLSLFNWIGSASEIFTIFYNTVFTWHFIPLIEFLLIIGLFSFVLCITSFIIRSGRK